MKLFKSLDKIATEIPVSEVMVKDVKYIKESDTVDKAVDLMAKHSISGLVVNDKDGKHTGMVSGGDLFRKVYSKNKNHKKVKIKEVMSTGIFSIAKDQSIGETAKLMKNKKISKLPVMENKMIIGYVTKSDLLEKLNKIYYQNTRLKWLPIIIMVLLIVIVILLIALVQSR